MRIALAELIAGLVETYAVLGLAFSAVFVTRGVTRIDGMAVGSPWSFRLLLVPGTIVFWPLLLLRWAAGSIAPPIETNAHRRAAR